MFYRDLARRILQERTYSDAVPRKPGGPNKVRETLWELVLAQGTVEKTRMAALFSLIGAGPLQEEDYDRLMKHPSSSVRAPGEFEQQGTKRPFLPRRASR